MIFEALPAQFGDCLILQAPTKTGAKLIVIDGGPGTVFADTLKDRLDELKPAGKALRIDAVMISHVDADHIVGVIGLLTAIRDASGPPPYRVLQLIFNGFDRLAETSEEETSGAGGVLKSMGGSSLDFGEHATSEVLASVAQGSQVMDLARALKIPLNVDANPKNGLFLVDGACPSFDFGDAKFLVVGPRRTELEKLRKAWATWRAKKDETSLKALAAYADTSVPNLSSIVALVSWSEKRLLLTGDARGDYILEGLELAGELKPGRALDRPLDILKLPHHGSSRNVAQAFFERLPARHYVASGDGWYGNPDRETIEMIAKARPKGDYTLHLTYDPDHIDTRHKAYKGQQKPPKVFDAASHSIKPALDRIRADGGTIHIGATRIDLGQGA